MAVSKDKYGVKTHFPVGEFEKCHEAVELCRRYRDKMKVDHCDAYIMQINPEYPLFIVPK